jgi:hypothetical protein
MRRYLAKPQRTFSRIISAPSTPREYNKTIE